MARLGVSPVLPPEEPSLDEARHAEGVGHDVVHVDVHRPVPGEPGDGEGVEEPVDEPDVYDVGIGLPSIALRSGL